MEKRIVSSYCFRCSDCLEIGKCRPSAPMSSIIRNRLDTGDQHRTQKEQDDMEDIGQSVVVVELVQDLEKVYT
jgi:hypothetical protein